MIHDVELELWRQEWQSGTELLPALMKKTKRENMWTYCSGVVLAACLLITTFTAFWTHSALVIGAAGGLWIATLVLVRYSWWVQRETWKPASQTTQAYLELIYKRASASIRYLRVAAYLIVGTVIICSGFLAFVILRVPDSSARGIAHKGLFLIPALVIELFFLRRYGRRKKLEMQNTKKLLDQLKLQA